MRSTLLGKLSLFVPVFVSTMTGHSYPPTYDGVGVDEYIEWEIAIGNIFATRQMCARRKVENAASSCEVML